jgi:diacylglycerol kinase family enzyme
VTSQRGHGERLVPSYSRVVAVVNPATKQDPTHITGIIREAAPPGITVEFCETVAGIPLRNQLGPSLATADAVVAAGGDGTVAAVATALGDSDVPLGIVPAGSTNVIAREQRIPMRPDHAARLVFGPHAYRRMDAGVCGDRRFLHMAGAGIDSRLFLATDSVAKRKRGWMAYLVPAMRSLAAPPSRFHIESDEVTLEVMSPLVLVANGTSILKPFLPTFRDIHPDDGWLDVIILTATSPLPMAKALGRFVTRTLDRSAYVTRIRTRHVRIDSEPALPVELDGDVVMQTPAEFAIAPGALRLIVPRS